MAEEMMCATCMGAGGERAPIWGDWDECPVCEGKGEWNPCRNCWTDPADEKDGEFCLECRALYEVEADRLHEQAHALGVLR